MKIHIVIIVGVVVVVAVVGAFFLFRGGSTAPTAVISSAPTLATTTPTLATTLAPDMTLTVVGSIEAQTIASSTSIYVGDTLTTSHSGRGLLQEANGTATLLDYDTKLTLEESDGTGTHVSGFLSTGAIWVRVKKVFGKGEYYKIRMQNAVAVARGTSFTVSYLKNIPTLKVVTGTVGFIPVDLATGEPIEGKEVFVSEGNKATSDDSGTVRVSPLTAADTWTPWDLYNVSNDVGPSGTPAPAAPEPSSQPASPAVPETTAVPSDTVMPTPTADAVSAENACATFSESQGYADSQTRGSLKLTSVSPPSVSQSGHGTVTLTGEGFICAITITIGDKDLSGESDFVVVNNSNITFSPDLLPIGTFDITIRDTLENTAVLSQAITVTR